MNSQALLEQIDTSLLGTVRFRQGRYRDAADVAAALLPEAPVFLFSASQLRSRLDEFLAGFPGEVSYAVKANPSNDVLLTMAGAGLSTFDVASLQEIETVRRIAPHAHVHYHNPIKSRAEIAAAYRDHDVVRFAVDDHAEIAKICEVANDDPRLEIAVRFRLPSAGTSVHDFSSKFGATPAEAVELLQNVALRGLKAVLTFHPGSQCRDPDAYRRHIAAAGEIAREAGVRLHRLNVGGGFPVSYVGNEAPPLSAFFAVIAEAAREAFGEVGAPMLECEPGRGLVGTSTSLLTRVKLAKPHRAEVFLNDGIYGALMEVYQAPALCPQHRVIRTSGLLAANTTTCTVYGPTCDPLDRLPHRLDLPSDITEDDFVEFGSLGAYGAATSTRFNGYGGAETIHVDSVLTA